MSDDSERFASAVELGAQLAKVFGLDTSDLLSFTLDVRAGKLPTLTTERLEGPMYAGDFEAISQRFELVPLRDAATTSSDSAAGARCVTVEVPYTDATGAIWRPAGRLLNRALWHPQIRLAHRHALQMLPEHPRQIRSSLRWHQDRRQIHPIRRRAREPEHRQAQANHELRLRWAWSACRLRPRSWPGRGDVFLPWAPSLGLVVECSQHTQRQGARPLVSRTHWCRPIRWRSTPRGAACVCRPVSVAAFCGASRRHGGPAPLSRGRHCMAAMRAPKRGGISRPHDGFCTA